MALKYVVGPPGSGKTRFLLRELQQACRAEPGGHPLFLLVPEQVSYGMEKELLANGVLGTTRARVLSFRRLQELISAQTPGAVRPTLTDVHYRALLTRILSEARRTRSSPLLKVNGLERSVTALVQEFEEYQVNAEQLSAWALQAKGRNGLLAAKLEELALIAKEFERLTQNRFETAEDARARLDKAVAGLDVLQGATLAVDAFDGFGPQEKELLKRLVPLFRSVTVALTIPAEDFRQARFASPDALALYYPVAETSHWFWETFHGEGQAAPVIVDFPGEDKNPPPIEERFAPTLASLRDAFLQQAPPGKMPEADSLQLAEVLTVRDEVRLAVVQLKAWHRAGMPWGNMGLVTRNLSLYAELIRHEFQRVGIPFFLDRLEPVENESMLYGLEAIAQLLLKGWNFERFCLLVKSRYFTTDYFERTRFLEYLEATRKGENDLYLLTQWVGVPSRDPEGIDRDEGELPFERALVEQEIITPYLDWRSTYKACVTISAEGVSVVEVAGFLQLLVEILSCFPVETERDEYLLKQLGGMLQSLYEVCEEDRLLPVVLYDLLTDSIGRITLPHIPPHLNEVLVGQVDRSRYQNIHGAVVLGFNDNQFPYYQENATLLTDEERELVEELSGEGDCLAPSARRLLARENFHAYKALTRGAKKCLVVRSLNDAEGQATTESPYWGELMRLFCLRSADLLKGSESVLTVEEAASFVARRGVANSPETSALKFGIEGLSASQKERWLRIQEVAADRNQAHLSPHMVRQLYSGEFQTSVSQLESFGNCPFQFFIKRTLRPEQTYSPSLTVMDFGQYSHALMSRLIREAEENEANFFALSPGELEGKILEHLGLLQQEYVRKGLLNSALQRLQLSTLDDAIVAWATRLHALLKSLGAKGMKTELSFGKGKELAAAPIQLRSPEGLYVTLDFRGRIDFMAEVGTKDFASAVLVVDFKLSERTLSWQQVLLGRDLQLPLYHYVVSNPPGESDTKGAVEAAALYVPIQDKRKKTISTAGVASASFAEGFNHLAQAAAPLENAAPYKFAGEALSGDQPKLIRDKFPALLKRIGEEILTGNAGVSPRRVGKQTACTFCNYLRACRLDFTINRPRDSASRKSADVLAEWLTES